MTRRLSAEQGDCIEFELKRGVFVMAGPEAWLIEDAATLTDSVIESSDWFALAKKAPAGVVRLVGESHQIDRFESLLKKHAVSLGRPAPLDPLPVRLQFLPKEARIRREVSDASPVKPVANPPRKTRVLVVDDSATVRKLLQSLISEDPELECVGAIEHPSLVEKAIVSLKPDVVTLDIHMPDQDGVSLLKVLRPKYPLAYIMISALNKEDGGPVLDALENGAMDYIQKPSLSELPVVAPLIREKIKQGRSANVPSLHLSQQRSVPQKVMVSSSEIDTRHLIVLGASTGGTEALRHVLTALPSSIPPILIVQHIPAVFSKAFADRLNELCPFEVKEASQGDIVKAGHVYIAPGGFQMRVKPNSQGELVVQIEDTPPVNRHKPSVDALFDSVAALKPKNLVAGILTGMGADGAKGLLTLKKLGAHTLAQDEASCVVFGMPREAIALGAANEVVGLDRFADRLVHAVRRRSAA